MAVKMKVKGQTQNILLKEDLIINIICCVQDEVIKNDYFSCGLSTGYRKVEF